MNNMNKLRVQLCLLLAILLLGNLVGFKYSFAAQNPAGTNISSNGTIYMVTDDGHIRPYTSAGAFLSYSFNSWANVLPASAEDMALPQGSLIPPRDGKIVCSDRGADKGTCYLITNGKTAAFVSEAVFKGLGFSFAHDLTGDVSFMEKDNNIASATEQHRIGVVIKQNGSLYMVGPSGLLSAPSLDVLKTWGYTADDEVTGNAADLGLSQTSILSGRASAQLSPISSSSSIPAVSEDELLQSYINTYPDFPVNTISAPQDGAMVIDLFKKIEAIPSNKLAPAYPYLSAQSIEMLNKSPKFSAYWESAGTHLIGMNPYSTDIKVFEGGTRALYTELKKQNTTGYTETIYWVAIKENGVWKWDVIGNLKYQATIAKQDNPVQTFTTGTGNTDISIVDAAFSDSPLVNDPNTWFLFLLKNNGQTTINKFHLVIRFNTVIVNDETDSYQLKPGESVMLASPIDYYWSLSGVNKSPGTYSADITVGFDRSTTDAAPDDNIKALPGTVFEQNNATSTAGSIVGSQ